jgi:hypothetical protein
LPVLPLRTFVCLDVVATAFAVHFPEKTPRTLPKVLFPPR